MNAFLAFMLPTLILGSVPLLWCRVRLGARLWLPLLLSSLVASAVAVALAASSSHLVDKLLALAALSPNSHAAIACGLAGLREEAAKLAVFLLVIQREPEIRTTPDRIMTMVVIALGFSIIENLSYLTIDQSTANAREIFDHTVMRMLLSTNFHIGCSVQAVATLELTRTSKWRRWGILAALLVPGLLHGLVDFGWHLGGRLGKPLAPWIEIGGGFVVMAGAMLLSRLVMPRAHAPLWKSYSLGLFVLLVISLFLCENFLTLAGWHLIPMYTPIWTGWEIIMPFCILAADLLIIRTRTLSEAKT